MCARLLSHVRLFATPWTVAHRAPPARLRWRVSGKLAGRCRGGQLEIMKQMSRQEYRGSAGEYQADEQAGVARLTWRVSGR